LKFQSSTFHLLFVLILFFFNYFSSRHAWNLLQEQLRRIDEDIATKDNTLQLEKRALATRKRMNTYNKPETETDKNLLITGVDQTGLSKVLGMQYA
jgi:hypothetical protein